MYECDRQEGAKERRESKLRIKKERKKGIRLIYFLNASHNDLDFVDNDTCMTCKWMTKER